MIPQKGFCTISDFSEWKPGYEPSIWNRCLVPRFQPKPTLVISSFVSTSSTPLEDFLTYPQLGLNMTFPPSRGWWYGPQDCSLDQSMSVSFRMGALNIFKLQCMESLTGKRIFVWKKLGWTWVSPKSWHFSSGILMIIHDNPGDFWRVPPTKNNRPGFGRTWQQSGVSKFATHHVFEPDSPRERGWVFLPERSWEELPEKRGSATICGFAHLSNAKETHNSMLNFLGVVI